jgi:Kdo2-lipid IVA lauroyltransferase/acyltransferase
LVCGMARRMRQGEDPPAGPWLDTPTRGRHFASTPEHPTLRFAVELVDIFGPEEWSTQPDPLFYLTARYRRAIEQMVRLAPEQYFWMHRIWRSRPAHERQNKPFPPLLREKLLSLPWMSPEDVERVVDRSGRDTMEIASRG